MKSKMQSHSNKPWSTTLKSKLSKALDAPVENIMDKAVAYIKGQTDKRKAFNAVTKKYGDQLSEKQVAGLQFVR